MDQFFSSISGNSIENEQIQHSLSTYIPKDGKNFELRELENRLKYAMEKCRIKDMIQLSERMKRTEERIQQYENEERIDAIEQETKYLNELKQLQTLSEEISIKYTVFLSKSIDKLELNELEDRLRYSLEKCQIKDVTQLIERIKRTEKRIEEYEDEERKDAAEQELKYLHDLEQLQKIIDEIFVRRSNVSTSKIEVDKQTNLENLRDDFAHMPCCAEKTTMELLTYFQQKLIQDCINENASDSIDRRLEKWQDQIQKEELISEQQIKTYFQDLNRIVYNEDWSSAVRLLSKILNQIRPLNVQELQRLIKNMQNTATLINDKDIILLVGITGSGKSTTVQFLAGAKMKNTLVEIAPGKFLEHVTVDGPVKNAGLSKVTSSPLSKSETRSIVPVTVQLKDILGPHQTGEIILCDAPGFSDTGGAEIDIANSIGVIEALKNCKSVKILALSSCRSLGDRGEGIQRLAHILINMMCGIEHRLDGILYAFTKYPSTTDIHALLTDIKISKVNEDPILRSDTAFVTVLTDMINKTKDNAEKIDPIHGKPENLIRKLNRLNGIRYPGEVFQFSISEQTQNTILKQIQIYKLNIICAIKHKNIDLIMYYLNNMKFLNDLLKNNSIQDVYINSIQFLNENIEQYSTDMIEKFHRYFFSQDGLRNEDIEEYKNAHDYIEQIQILRIHLGSKLVSANILIENILSELEKRSLILQKEDLYSPSIGIFLNNFYLLQNSIKKFEPYYMKICQDIGERFELTLVEPVAKLLSSNEFKQIAEIISIISKCLPVLNYHINRKVETNYRNIVNLILEYLSKCFKETNSILSKTILNENDIEILRNYINLSKSIKEIFTFENEISKYIEMIELKTDIFTEILQHFDQINIRIKELFDKNKNHALEDIEQLVIQMEMIRTLPDIEVKTNRIFYHTIQNIRGYMQQLQRDAEELLINLQHQSGINHFRPLSRLLLRLKNSSWIDRILPETSDILMGHIREELKEYVDQLENRLKKIDFNLKYPDNIRLVQEILQKIESMEILEETIPELKIYRNRINNYFLQIITEVFKYIQMNFNLANNKIDHLKQELIELKQIKKQYDQLYPARIYLQKSGYRDINVLNHDIENFKIQQDLELKEVEIEKHQIESQLNDYNITIQHPKDLSLSKIDQGFFDQLFSKVTKKFQRFQNYSQQRNSNNTKTQIQEDYNKLLQTIEQKRIQFHEILTNLEHINMEYQSLLTSSHLIHPNEKDFLEEKGQTSYELLEKTIEEKTQILIEYEQYKQMYYFATKLDAFVANNALIYISNCEKVGHHDVQEMAENIGELLKKYLEEYGYFLDKEIERNFKHITNFDKNNFNQYSEDLEKRLEELFSLKKYALVFENLHGTEKLECWQREFFNYHRYLENQMEIWKISGNNQEFRNHLIIAQTLSCIDRFCTTKLANNGFQTLYRHYQIDIARESKEAYNRVIDYISKDDYGNVDLTLADIFQDSSNSRLLNQIKNDLHCSLNKIIKNTKTCTYYLHGKFERQENHQDKIREIIENIDKIRIVLNRYRIIELIDDETKNSLQKFEHEISQILSTTILNRMKDIEIFIDHNSFLQAEQSMENLIRIQHELVGYYTSKLVEIKTEEIKIRLNTLPNDILQRYDFENLNNYSKNPPKDILDQLKKVISGGYPRYIQIYNLFLEKIRTNFILAIDKVRIIPWNNRSIEIRKIKNVFLFLPEELKNMLQLQIDELNDLSINDTTSVEFD